MNQGVRASTQLRMLQQGPAAGGRRCRDVQLRMYLLSELRGDVAGWGLPELWGRIGGSAQPPGPRSWRSILHPPCAWSNRTAAPEPQPVVKSDGCAGAS